MQAATHTDVRVQTSQACAPQRIGGRPQLDGTIIVSLVRQAAHTQQSNVYTCKTRMHIRSRTPHPHPLSCTAHVIVCTHACPLCTGACPLRNYTHARKP